MQRSQHYSIEGIDIDISKDDLEWKVVPLVINSAAHPDATISRWGIRDLLMARTNLSDEQINALPYRLMPSIVKQVLCAAGVDLKYVKEMSALSAINLKKHWFIL